MARKNDGPLTLCTSAVLTEWSVIPEIAILSNGDISGGKVIGAVLLTFGMVFLTLPMTIIVSKFGTVYESEKQNLSNKKQKLSDLREPR